MKRVNVILVALSLSLLFAGQLWAQRDRAAWTPHSLRELPYRPWATFVGDTARYLEFNYSIRGMQYVGWTVGELLDELELPVINITNEMRIVGREGPSRLVGLSLGIRQKFDTPNARWDYYINIRFENPPYLDEFREVSPRGNRAFTPEIYNFIRDLKISGVSSNELILRDPELVERRRRVFEENRRRGREAREEFERQQERRREMREEFERQREHWQEMGEEYLERQQERWREMREEFLERR